MLDTFEMYPNYNHPQFANQICNVSPMRSIGRIHAGYILNVPHFSDVIALCPKCGRSIKLGTLRSHDWVHSKSDQQFSQEQIKTTFMGTFSINPTFAHWAHWSHLLSVLPMYPACAWWVFGSLSPVPVHASSSTPTTSSPTTSPTTSLSLSLVLFLLLVLLLLLELGRRTRTLDGTESAGRLLTVVLALDGTTLFPSEDGLTFDIVGFQVLDVVGLADGLDQHTHLIWELGDEDHGLEVRRDGAFGCCHSGEADKDGINGESRIGVSGDDDVHRHLKFFVCGSDSGFTVGGFKILPSYGSEHSVDVGVFLNSFLEEV